MLVHLYKLTNTLPNHDSVYNYYSDQNMIDSGRWTLVMVGGISSFFDLPWLNGLLCCLHIALTVVVIVALFRIKNPVVIGLSGALLAVSPAVTETLFFNEETGKIAPAGKVYMLSALLETNLLMDHEHTILYLRENFRMDIPSVPYHELPGLAQQAQVKEMACWPAVGSMAVIDGILIIKLADT